MSNVCHKWFWTVTKLTAIGAKCNSIIWLLSKKQLISHNLCLYCWAYCSKATHNRLSVDGNVALSGTNAKKSSNIDEKKDSNGSIIVFTVASVCFWSLQILQWVSTVWCIHMWGCLLTLLPSHLLDMYYFSLPNLLFDNVYLHMFT